MLATLSGTMLAPGVSKNGRLYTPDAIAKAVTRMQARLADENARPIVMRTHHDAGDDTTKVVGHLTAVKLDDDGRARYEAVLNRSAAAQDVLAAAGDEDARSLRNVSIYGWWAGQPRTVKHEGQAVETCDDIEIDAVDFTAFPGVAAARIDTVTPAAGRKSRESAEGRRVITESVDAQVSFVDEAAAKGLYMIHGEMHGPEGLTVLKAAASESAQPMGKRTAGLKGPGGPYADPGYQKDKKPRYQLDTKARAKAAWSYINQAKNAEPYNATQLKAIKGRIRAALKKFGVDVTKESVTTYAELLGETTLSECYACDGDRAGFSISAHNGPINVNISAYDGIDPAELEVITQAAMAAACDALKALDPDMDADIDVDGAPNADTDGSMENDDAMESAPVITATPGVGLPGATITPRDMAAFLARKKATETTETPAPTEAGPTVKESAVTDQQQAAETAATTTTESADKPLTAADLKAAVTEAFGPVVDALKALAPQAPAAAPAATATTDTTTAPPATTTENAPATTTAESTTKADVTEMQKALKAAVREHIPELLAEYGLPRRKGVVTETASDQPAQTPEQLWANRGAVWNTVLPGGTPAAPTPPTSD